MARPTKYLPEFATWVLKLCRIGATDAQIATFFDVDERTINRWKKQHPEFCQSLKNGKLVADLNVVDALYSRAVGHYYTAQDIRTVKGRVVLTPVERYLPPDTTACIFWLKNRQAETWREKNVAAGEKEVVIVHNALQIPNSIQRTEPTS